MRLIYVIDDERSILKAIQRIFKTENYEVMTFEQSQPMMDEISHNRKPDLVIVDNFLGETTGVELSQWIKQNSPQTKVLLMTGFIQDAQLEKGFAQKLFDDILTKPWQINEILDKVKKLTS